MWSVLMSFYATVVWIEYVSRSTDLNVQAKCTVVTVVQVDDVTFDCCYLCVTWSRDWWDLTDGWDDMCGLCWSLWVEHTYRETQTQTVGEGACMTDLEGRMLCTTVPSDENTVNTERTDLKDLKWWSGADAFLRLCSASGIQGAHNIMTRVILDLKMCDHFLTVLTYRHTQVFTLSFTSMGNRSVSSIYIKEGE